MGWLEPVEGAGNVCARLTHVITTEVQFNYPVTCPASLPAVLSGDAEKLLSGLILRTVACVGRPFADRAGLRGALRTGGDVILDGFRGYKRRAGRNVAIDSVGGAVLNFFHSQLPHNSRREDSLGRLDGNRLFATARWEEGFVGDSGPGQALEAFDAVVVRTGTMDSLIRCQCTATGYALLRCVGRR